MKQAYDDLMFLGKLRGEAPQWWDECGVPRFCEPHPSKANCIYSRAVVFYRIKCQACGKQFVVADSEYVIGFSHLQRAVMDHKIHYGDPPNIGCCPAGPTMNSEPLEVVSFWLRDSKADWREVPELRGKSLTEPNPNPTQ